MGRRSTAPRSLSRRRRRQSGIPSAPIARAGSSSLVELLQGRFSKPVMERLCSQESGLFPRPSEIRFTCSCPDHASMCKHVAAVLYGIGARLDQSPELLFRLRAVDETALLADLGAALPGARKGPEAGKTLVGDDLAALFGLDIAEGGAPAALPLPEAALLAPRKVAAKGTAAQIAFAKTAPARGKPAQKTKAAPTKAAQNKTTAARTRAKAKREASKKATTAGRKPPAKSLASMQAAAPSCLQSGPVIGNSTPVREFRSRRPVRSATRKRMISSNGREPAEKLDLRMIGSPFFGPCRDEHDRSRNPTSSASRPCRARQRPRRRRLRRCLLRGRSTSARRISGA